MYLICFSIFSKLYKSVDFLNFHRQDGNIKIYELRLRASTAKKGGWISVFTFIKSSFTAQSINKVNWIKSYYLQEWNLTFSDCKKIKTKWNSSKNTLPIRNASGFINMKEKEHKLKLCCAHAMYYLDIRFIDSKCFSGGKWKSMLMLVFSEFINDLTIFLQVCTSKNVIKQLMIIRKSLNCLIWPWPTI